MNFRKANQADIQSIIEINKSLLKKDLKNNDKGFLLGARSEDDITEKIQFYYVALDERDEILGYVETGDHIADDNFAIGQWEDENLKREVLDRVSKTQFIYVIQIASKVQRRGVGSFILDQLAKMYEDKILILFVAHKPDFNEVSLNFHLKAGFKLVGNFTMESKFGISNYERICLFK